MSVNISGEFHISVLVILVIQQRTTCDDALTRSCAGRIVEVGFWVFINKCNLIALDSPSPIESEIFAIKLLISRRTLKIQIGRYNDS